jgi:hypothetical protein
MRAIGWPRRVGVRNAIGLGVLLGLAVWAVHSRTALAHVARQVGGLPPPSWPWIVLAVAAIAASYWCSALALRAAVGRRLPLGRTVLVQLAASAANRITPGGLGGAAVNGRFLTTQGSSLGRRSNLVNRDRARRGRYRGPLHRCPGGCQAAMGPVGSRPARVAGAVDHRGDRRCRCGCLVRYSQT